MENNAIGIFVLQHPDDPLKLIWKPGRIGGLSLGNKCEWRFWLIHSSKATEQELETDGVCLVNFADKPLYSLQSLKFHFNDTIDKRWFALKRHSFVFWMGTRC